MHAGPLSTMRACVFVHRTHICVRTYRTPVRSVCVYAFALTPRKLLIHRAPGDGPSGLTDSDCERETNRKLLRTCNYCHCYHDNRYD